MPSECINPVAVQFAQKYVSMSVSYSGGGSLPYTTTTAPQPRSNMSFLVRADTSYKNHMIDLRYYRQGPNVITSNSVSSGQGVANYELDRNTAALNFGSIGDTWVLGSNLLNVFRAGYKRCFYNISPTDPTTLSTLGADLTLPGAVTLPELTVYNRFSLGSINSDASHVINQTIEFDDNVSWTRGNHNYQAGATWLHLLYNQAQNYPGNFHFSPTYFDLFAADFLSGLMYQEAVQNTINLDAVAPNLYLYAQNDWRATPKRTVNYDRASRQW